MLLIKGTRKILLNAYLGLPFCVFPNRLYFLSLSLLHSFCLYIRLQDQPLRVQRENARLIFLQRKLSLMINYYLLFKDLHSSILSYR